MDKKTSHQAVKSEILAKSQTFFFLILRICVLHCEMYLWVINTQVFTNFNFYCAIFLEIWDMRSQNSVTSMTRYFQSSIQTYFFLFLYLISNYNFFFIIWYVTFIIWYPPTLYFTFCNYNGIKYETYTFFSFF